MRKNYLTAAAINRKISQHGLMVAKDGGNCFFVDTEGNPIDTEKLSFSSFNDLTLEQWEKEAFIARKQMTIRTIDALGFGEASAA